MRYRRVPKIGLMRAKLSGDAPRGVTRIAQGAAEAWVESDEVELLAFPIPSIIVTT